MRAAVFGEMQNGLEPEELNPWVTQWAEDVKFLAEDCGEEFDIEMWVEWVGARALINLNLMHWILKIDVSRVRRYVDVEEPGREEGDPRARRRHARQAPSLVRPTALTRVRPLR